MSLFDVLTFTFYLMVLAWLSWLTWHEKLWSVLFDLEFIFFIGCLASPIAAALWYLGVFDGIVGS